MAINRAVRNTMRYKQTPDPTPLIEAVEKLATEDADELERYASDISAMVPYWDKTDAIVEGYEAVRLASEEYLPKFVNETPDEYAVRLSLTKFTNIYRDVLEGLASKPFEEEITLIEPKNPDIEAFCEDVDGYGNNLSQFAGLTFFNGINSAIDWIMVDYPIVDTTVIRTKADQKANNIRPFWNHILARNVREVRTGNYGGKKVITYIRIFEPGVSEPDRVRIFEKDGAVKWYLWEKLSEPKDGKMKYHLVNEGALSIDVIPLVPFVTGRRDGTSWKFFPAMRDAADLQIKLYQAESGLEFITTIAAYPMLTANGLRPEMEADGKTAKKVLTGPMRVLWGLPDGNGNHGEWGMLEPSSESMRFLQDKIKETKTDLRELGRQPLTATSGQLTVITTAVAAGKARSAVSAWALLLKDTLENVLVITAKYLGLTGVEQQVNVFNEFDNFTEGDNGMTELGQARRSGDLSRETYWSELKRRKSLSPEFDAEEEEKRLAAELPSDPDLEEEDDNTNPDKLPGNVA